MASEAVALALPRTMPRWLFLLLSSLLAVAGVALRLVDLGRYGFWNDEAWVALTTRVQTLPQFWLSIGHTPIGFVLLLRAIPVSLPPELALRAVPFLFGCATMAIAWRLGHRVAGPAGALAALATVSFDPLEIAFAKQLKQYTAEAFFAVAALDALQAFAVVPSRGTRRWLALSLCVGVVFGTAQLFVAGPVLVVAIAFAIPHGEPHARRAELAMLAMTVAWLLAWYVEIVAPHVTGRLSMYFANDYIPAGSVADAARFAWAEVSRYLADMLGSWGWMVGAAALVVASALAPAYRPIGLAVVLLLLEMIGLGLARLVPFGANRVMLFCYGALGCGLAVAIGCVVSMLARGTTGRALALGLVLLLVADGASSHDWRHLGDSPRVEDVGPLLRMVEAERAPDDVLLVYGRTLFVYAYYQRAVPVLVAASNTTGSVPLVSDPRVRLVDATSVAAEGARAYADAPVVWFVGSRMGADGMAVGRWLEQHGTLTRREARTDALLLKLRRRDAGSP
jgi:hypothetical protein